MCSFLKSRWVLCALLTLGTVATDLGLVHAANLEKSGREVALVFQVGEALSPSVLAEMQAESNRILKGARVRLTYTSRQEAAMNTYTDLLFFRLKGQCEMDNLPSMLDERGPLAWSFTEEGKVLPFGEVECARIKHSIKSVMHGKDFSRGNKLLGRALGRVVAHEVFHMLTGTKHHSQEGVFKEALSAKQLIADKLDFTDRDYEVLSGTRDFSR